MGLCISGSIDRTCKIWNVTNGQCINTLRGHNDEILDVAFNTNGSKLVTASADGTSRVYNTQTGACQAILIGHEGEISKVSFNPQGNKIITASRCAFAFSPFPSRLRFLSFPPFNPIASYSPTSLR